MNLNLNRLEAKLSRAYVHTNNTRLYKRLILNYGIDFYFQMKTAKEQGEPDRLDDLPEKLWRYYYVNKKFQFQRTLMGRNLCILLRTFKIDSLHFFTTLQFCY